MESKTSILIAVVLLLAIAVIYLLINPVILFTDNKEGAILEEGDEMMDGDNIEKPNYMEHQTPPALTEDQKTQLKLGAEAHTPQTVTFNISAGSFFFMPNEIRVKQGDRVRFIIENLGGTHNLILPEFNVEIPTLQIGDQDTVEFVVDKKGIFEFYCGIGNGYHRQQGQIGVLIVE